MKDITLRQLRFLVETVRTGSLAGAASACHVTGPAIAQQLRLLEKAVGLPLLERGPEGQTPTEAGRILVAAAHRIEAELATCTDTVVSLRKAESGHVTLGAVSTAKYFTPQVLAHFQRAHPGIRVSMNIGNRREIIDRLEEYEIDLAIMGRAPSRLEVEQEFVGDHPYAIIAPPDHPLVGAGPVAFSVVAKEPFLVREPGSGTRLHAEDLFARAGLPPAYSMEISSNETIKQAVIAGLGVALISEHTVAAEIHDGRLALLEVEGLPIMRQWLVVRMARRSVSPATQAMWDFFVTEAQALLPTP